MAGAILLACGVLLGWWARGRMPRGVMSALVYAHRQLFRAYWRWRSRSRGGRPPLDPKLIALIRRMSLENPLWGAPRIHAELLLLGYALSQSSVSKYMAPRHIRPTNNWQTFLAANADAIAAVDLLTVPTLGFQRLYAFVVLAHSRRLILHVEVADHPTAMWLAGEIVVALGCAPPAFLIRDNDRAYGALFRRALAAKGVTDRPTQPHSPWQNGHIERLIGSIRRECLNHCIILDAAHLRRLLSAYVDYYNNDRPHLALQKNAPIPRAIEHQGRIHSRPILGGLHHRYGRKPGK